MNPIKFLSSFIDSSTLKIFGCLYFIKFEHSNFKIFINDSFDSIVKLEGKEFLSQIKAHIFLFDILLIPL